MDEKVASPSIEDDNNYFKKMLDLIPPTIYFDDLTKQQIHEQTNQEPTEEKSEPSEKSKNKKKYKKDHVEKQINPFKSKSVSQIQEQLYNTDTEPQHKFTDIKYKPPFQTLQSSIPMATSSDDTQDKRSKLWAKIEEFQAKRKLNDTSLQEKRKLKKQKKKDKKQKSQKSQANKTAINGLVQNNTPNNSPSKNNRTPTKPIFNKEGQMVFSKFDFTDSAKKLNNKKSDLSGKDYKRLLEKIERRNEKINKVKGRDEDAAKSLQNKFRWECALQKAEGKKVKDDVEVLKKALKRKEKMKDQKKKKWQTRTETTEKFKDLKLAKRTKNISDRKKSVKDNKMKKLKKRGRIIPGF